GGSHAPARQGVFRGSVVPGQGVGGRGGDSCPVLGSNTVVPGVRVRPAGGEGRKPHRPRTADDVRQHAGRGNGCGWPASASGVEGHGKVVVAWLPVLSDTIGV